MSEIQAESTKKKQFTTLLDNNALGRLERMRLNSVKKMTNRRQGEHLSGKGGTSTEFSDYRDYAPGDDMRYVDWNIFSRLHRPYVKQYRYEEEMNVVILIDASSSMAQGNKLFLAKQIAAACGLMGLLNFERVSLYVSHQESEDPLFFPPCTGRASRSKLFKFLENIEGGGDAPVDYAIEALLKRHRSRGIVILLSDFLTWGNIARSFNLLFSAGLEIFATQILSPEEIDPELAGDLRLIDSETGGTLDISSAGDLLGIYQEHRHHLEVELSQECRRRQGRFLSLSSDIPVNDILFDLFHRKGWVR
jgi:uncharacterized protein (DUF58 family)